MPHLTIEYSDNLHLFDTVTVLADLNAALMATGYFYEADIKSRAIRLNEFLVGVSNDERAFVHARLAVMPRPVEVRRILSATLLERLKQLYVCPENVHLQLSVEVVELDSDCYAKAVVEG